MTAVGRPRSTAAGRVAESLRAPCCAGAGADRRSAAAPLLLDLRGRFPWTEPACISPPSPLRKLTNLLRRLPLVIRQLRVRQADRPPFRVEEERDLEDLVRSLLPLHFDNIRPEGRTPHYTTTTRTDFLLARGDAVTVKLSRSAAGLAWLVEQFEEDAACYRDLGSCDTLVGFVHDPEHLLHNPEALERACAGSKGWLWCAWSELCEAVSPVIV